MQKKYLFIYYPGARGDFLASILIGNILSIEWKSPWIVYIGPNQYWCKMHEPGNFYTSTQDTFTSFEDYTVIRIKLEPDDYLKCKKLAMFKMRDFYTDMNAINNHEQHFASFDQQFAHVVPFKDLFDVDKIEDLFFEFRNRKFTNEERQRVIHNIELQNNILKNP